MHFIIDLLHNKMKDYIRENFEQTCFKKWQSYIKLFLNVQSLKKICMEIKTAVTVSFSWVLYIYNLYQAIYLLFEIHSNVADY